MNLREEKRNPRFAELDALIKLEPPEPPCPPVKQKPGPKKGNARPPTHPPRPPRAPLAFGVVILTGREVDILGHLRQGECNKEIASALSLTEGTVKVYLSRLFDKLGCPNRIKMALWASRQELKPHMLVVQPITLPDEEKRAVLDRTFPLLSFIQGLQSSAEQSCTPIACPS